MSKYLGVALFYAFYAAILGNYFYPHVFLSNFIGVMEVFVWIITILAGAMMVITHGVLSNSEVNWDLFNSKEEKDKFDRSVAKASAKFNSFRVWFFRIAIYYPMIGFTAIVLGDVSLTFVLTLSNLVGWYAYKVLNIVARNGKVKQNA